MSFIASVVMSLALAQTTLKGVSFVPSATAGYTAKIDFAELERQYPVSPNALQTWTIDDLAKLNAEQVDQLYARLPAGPTPSGVYKAAVMLKQASLKGKVLGSLAQLLWSGKKFDHEAGTSRCLVEDDVLHRGLLKTLAWALLGHSPKLAQTARTETAAKSYLALFPAKTFCGQSLIDSRRESIVIDYAFGDTIAGYQPDVDGAMTRNELGLREELRRVRPGLYLGRAYLHQSFIASFALQSDETSELTARGEPCWTGR